MSTVPAIFAVLTHEAIVAASLGDSYERGEHRSIT